MADGDEKIAELQNQIARLNAEQREMETSPHRSQMAGRTADHLSTKMSISVPLRGTYPASIAVKEKARPANLRLSHPSSGEDTSISPTLAQRRKNSAAKLSLSVVTRADSPVAISSVLRDETMISATCEDPRHPITNLFDGNSKSRWMSTGLYPHCILIDFNASTKVSIIKLSCCEVEKIEILLSGTGDECAFERCILSDISHSEREPIQSRTFNIGLQIARKMKIIIHEGRDEFCTFYSLEVRGQNLSDTEGGTTSRGRVASGARWELDDDDDDSAGDGKKGDENGKDKGKVKGEQGSKDSTPTRRQPHEW